MRSGRFGVGEGNTTQAASIAEPLFFCALSKIMLAIEIKAVRLLSMEANTIAIDLGNNEEIRRGIFTNADGTFTAMTFARSKTFKTYAGALRWFKTNTGQ